MPTLTALEPDILHTPAVKQAVGHNCQSLELRLPARREAIMEQDGSSSILLQPLVDFPNKMPALVLIRLHRLSVEQLVDLGIAIRGIVTVRAAGVILVELRVGVVHARTRQIQSDFVILAVDLWKPVGRFNGLKFPININFLELIDQYDGRIAERRGVADGHLDGEALLQSVAGLLHDVAGFRAVLSDVGIIAGQCLQNFGRQTPDTLWRRLHRAADIALALRKNIDEAFAIEREGHGPAYLRAVEGRSVAVHDQIGALVCRLYLTD